MSSCTKPILATRAATPRPKSKTTLDPGNSIRTADPARFESRLQVPVPRRTSRGITHRVYIGLVQKRDTNPGVNYVLRTLIDPKTEP